MADPPAIHRAAADASNRMKTTRPLLIILIQLGLLSIELLTRYDTWPRQIALSVTNVVAVVGVLFFDRWLARRGGRLSWLTVVLAFGAVWLDALGNFQHLYAGFWWWDRVTHVVGGMAVSAGFIDLYQTWRRGGGFNVSWGQATWLGFLAGQFVASMYEVSEWLGDMWFGTNRVVFRYDTPHDLFFNAAGGGLVVFLAWISRKIQLPGG